MAGDDGIVGSTRYTAKDFEVALRKLPVFRVMLWLVPVWLVGLIGLAPAPDERSSLVMFVAQVLMFGLVLLGGWFFVIKRGARGALARLAGDGERPASFRLDQDGLHVDSGPSKTVTAWSAVQRFDETPELFLVFFGAHQVCVLPKRAFAGEDVERVGSYLRQRTKVSQKLSPAKKALLAVVVIIVAWSIWEFLNDPARAQRHVELRLEPDFVARRPPPK